MPVIYLSFIIFQERTKKKRRRKNVLVLLFSFIQTYTYEKASCVCCTNGFLFSILASATEWNSPVIASGACVLCEGNCGLQVQRCKYTSLDFVQKENLRQENEVGPF